MRQTEVQRLLDKAHTKLTAVVLVVDIIVAVIFTSCQRTRKMIFIDTKITWMTKATTWRRRTEPNNVPKNERIKGSACRHALGPARCQNYSMKPLIPLTHNAKCSRIGASTSSFSKQQKQKDPNNGAAALL